MNVANKDKKRPAIKTKDNKPKVKFQSQAATVIDEPYKELIDESHVAASLNDDATDYTAYTDD